MVLLGAEVVVQQETVRKSFPALTPSKTEKTTRSFECCTSVKIRSQEPGLLSVGQLPYVRKKGLVSQDWNRYWFHELLFALSTCALRLKNHRYRDEKEIRIYVAGGDNAQPFKASDGRGRVAIAFCKSAIVRIGQEVPICGAAGPALDG
jgi:hypothetical protein